MGRAKKILSKRRGIGGSILIFITVGTHEQGMDRLFVEIDRLIECGIIREDVFAQIGYTEYKPRNFKYMKMIGYTEMDRLVKESEIIITHGGPGSIFHPLQYEKIPIVVPRNDEFNEHVDNHQILFAKRLEESKKIIAVYDIENLEKCIKNYKELSENCKVENNSAVKFINKFNLLINKLFK